MLRSIFLVVYRLVVSPFHHPSTVEFFRLSIASSKKGQGVFLSKIAVY